MLKIFTAMLLVTLFLPFSWGYAQDLSSMRWDEVVAEARKEGQLNWFNWYFQDRFRQQVKAFELEYGVKVTIPDGSLQANINKLLAEKNRTQGDIDVFSIGADQLDSFDVTKLFWGPLQNRLPDSEKLRFKMAGVDSHGYAVAFWGNQSVIAYNSARLNEADVPRTLDQFERFIQKNPGELAFNVENGGSGPAFIEAITRKLVPDVNYRQGDASPDVLRRLAPAWAWFNKYKGDYVITASNADSITRLNAGEFEISPSWEDFVLGLQHQGEISRDIKFYIPDFGMPGGGNVVAIPANAKHKAAALVFIYWLTRSDTQAHFHQVFGSAPQSKDMNNNISHPSTGLDRAKSLVWAKKPLGDEIRKQFVDNVLMK